MILRSRTEAGETCRRWLVDNGYTPHGDIWKNWDLAQALPRLGNGDLLDMGCRWSYVLRNKRGTGRQVGIDLEAETDPAYPSHEIRRGDLTAVPEPDASFDYITCLSVLEHGVNFEDFAREAARLLRPGGLLFVTFDYWWQPIPPSSRYGIPWNILDPSEVRSLVGTLADAGLFGEWDPELGPLDFDPPIELGGRAYTFMYLAFRKLTQ